MKKQISYKGLSQVIQHPERVFIGKQGQSVIHIDPKQVRHFPKAVKESAFVDVQLPGCGQGVPVLGKVYAQGPGVFRVGGPVIFHDTGNGRMAGSA